MSHHYVQRQSMTKPGIGTIGFFSGPLRRSRLTKVTFVPDGSTASYVVPACAHEAVLHAPTALAVLRLMATHRRPEHPCDLAPADEDE